MARQQVDLPPPEKRLCRKHGRPIQPSAWKAGYRTIRCAKCNKERISSPESRQRRSATWEKNFILCTNHPNRRCNKSSYVHGGVRRCSSCWDKLANGNFRPRRERSLKRKDYRKMVEKRVKYLSNGMRGIELFNRSIGYNFISPTGAITI